MSHTSVLKHEFVEHIPSDLEEGTVYVSIPFATVAHKCCCGCGREVVTPLSPTDWQLTFDGRSVSLYPSIGNWNYPCRSHYFITCNRVEWAPGWSEDEIAAGRAADARAKARYYRGNNQGPTPLSSAPQPSVSKNTPSTEKPKEETAPESFWQKVKRWFGG